MENESVRKVLLTTDGKILVDGEKGIVEITDPDFTEYLKRGITLEEVKVTPGAQTVVDTAYDEEIEKKLKTKTRRIWFPENGTTTADDEVNSSSCTSFTEVDAWKKFYATIESDSPNGKKVEAVDHPAHYNSHPSGVECIDIARHYDFNIGNAIKYLWRHGLKSEEGKTDVEKSIEDLRKAVWYINDEIQCLEKETAEN